MNKRKKYIGHPLFLPLFALGILLLFNGLFVKGFFSITMNNGQLYGRMIDILNRSSILVIISLGMTLVIATGGIDISSGSVIAISGALVCSLIGGASDGSSAFPMGAAIVLAIVVGAVCGAWNGFLVAKINVQPIVATLILQTAGRGIAMLMTQGQIVTVYYKAFSYIGNTIPGNILPTTIFIAAAMVLLLLLIMKRTSTGIFIQSVGINAKASYYAGIKVATVTFLAYVFSGICAGVAGVMEASMISAADANNAGLHIEMDAILAVALGGTLLSGGKFSIGGSIIGALTIQTLTTTMYAIGVSSDQLPVVEAMVVIMICLLQSETFKSYFASRRLRAQKGEWKHV